MSKYGGGGGGGGEGQVQVILIYMTKVTAIVTYVITL